MQAIQDTIGKGNVVPFTAALAGDLSLFIDSVWSAGAALVQSARERRAARAADIAVASGEDAIELVAPAWRSIESVAGGSTAFQSLALAERAAEAHLRCGEIPRIIVVHEAGRPVVVFPTVITRWSGIPTIRFLGDPLIQYGDAIVAPEATAAHIEAAWRAAADPAAGKLIYLRKVRGDARIAPVLARTMKVLAVHEAPYIDAHRPAAPCPRDARELRRFRRRLAEFGDPSFEILRGREALGAVREAFDMKRGWLDARGLPSSVVGRSDWEHAILGLAARGASTLQVARLAVGGRTAAIEIGLVDGGRWCAFLGATAPQFAKAGPGHVQMEETIAHCRRNGIAVYDLLSPADAYKRTLAHDAVVVRDHAAALSGAGWLGVLAARSVPILKDVAARMPTRLRRTIMSFR